MTTEPSPTPSAPLSAAPSAEQTAREEALVQIVTDSLGSCPDARLRHAPVPRDGSSPRRWERTAP